MITLIKIVTSENATGKKFDQIRIWAGGLPFSFNCDADEYTLNLTRRLSRENNIEFLDCRTSQA